MAWKIIIEVIAGLAIIVLANIFWSSVKSPGYLRNMMANYEELVKYIRFIGKDMLIQVAEETENLDSQKMTYEDIIRLWLLSSFKALAKSRNIMLILILLIVIGSFFLAWYFVLINMGLLILMGFNKISSTAQNEVYKDIKFVMLNLYKWHQIDPAACKEFCLEKRLTFKPIYTAIVDELL